MKRFRIEKINEFLVRKEEYYLLDFYNNTDERVQEMLENLYRVAYRFNFTDSQTIYLLREAMTPFDTELILI